MRGRIVHGSVRRLALGLLVGVGMAGCGGEDAGPGPEAVAGRHPLLAAAPEIVFDGSETLASAATPAQETLEKEVDRAAGEATDPAAVVVDYPFEGSVFPPGFVPPTILWHDASEAADTWWVRIDFADAESAPLSALLPGAPLPPGEIDERAVSDTNEPYEPSPYEASARTWTPSRAAWDEIQRRMGEAGATLTFHGFASGRPAAVLSRGGVTLRTAPDPVGAPIFYRDVPLMPEVGEKGVIKPLGDKAIPLIAWRLRDVTLPESRLLLTDMPSCANCHSFSRDGRTFGMDVDGPHGDKGTYAIAPVRQEITIEYEDVITWNSFPDKPAGHKTIGFLSQVSPDGRYVVTTVNEDLYVMNFASHEFLQVFFPTRGILAWYDTETEEMRALPGADDPAFVHCDPAWTPDGQTLVFARATAFDPYPPGREPARYAGDPNEPQVRYDLYRISFDGGRGGTPVPVEGASRNGMSNTFPKVTPDGRWIVFVKCQNGQLMRPDGRLWIVPLEGGEAREMECNLPRMNSWHSFSPNGRWMVWSSKSFTPYTQMFLTHLGEDGSSSPAVLIPNATAANRAVNIPEFLNAPYDRLQRIRVPAVRHHRYFWEGTRRLESGDVHGAVSLLQRALEFEPDFTKAHVNLGIAYLRLGETETALGHYEAALRIDPEELYALVNMARALVQMDRAEEGSEYARRALGLDPEHRNANFAMGEALVALGQVGGAVQHFERALAIDPRFRPARTSLAFALVHLERYDAALAHLQALLERDPRDRDLRRTTVALLFRMGRDAEGVSHLEVLVGQDPDDVRSLSTLAWHLATHPEEGVRDGRRAVELASHACALSRDERPEPLDALAAAYAESGDFPRAVEAASRALALAEALGLAMAGDVRERLAGYRARRPFRHALR